MVDDTCLSPNSLSPSPAGIPTESLDTPARRHEAVRVVWGDQSADIDEAIAPLILEIWKAGIRTANSCEDNVPRGFVWIQFPTTQDAERFLNIIGEYEDEEPAPSRYRRVLAEAEWPGEWRYAVGLEDWAVDCEVDEENWIVEKRTRDRPMFCFWVSIRFPRSDIRWVTQRITDHNVRAEGRSMAMAGAGPGTEQGVGLVS
jgi:hypothetical protein